MVWKLCLVAWLSSLAGAVAQEAEIIEAKGRMAIINSGDEQGIHRSDTLWVSEAADKDERLIAKAKVIALRKHYAAIEAFQFFGAYGLAVGQFAYRVKDVPAPFTSPPRRIRQQSKETELTLADIYRQRPRFALFVGGAVPLGRMAEAFAGSFSAGIGARLPVFPSVQMNLSGRYVFLRERKVFQDRLKAAGQESKTSMLVIATTFRPIARLFILEVGPALYQSMTQTTANGKTSHLTFNDGGLVVNLGKYFSLSEGTAWAVFAGFHNYFGDQGSERFLTMDVQFDF